MSPTTTAGNQSNTATRTGDGTSEASPMAAGVALKILEGNPELAPWRLYEVLRSQAWVGKISGITTGPNRLLNGNANTDQWSDFPVDGDTYALDGLDAGATYEVRFGQMVDGEWSEYTTPVSATTAAAVTRVTKTVDTAWAVRARAAKTIGATWDVRERVTKTAATDWRALARTSKTSSVAWHVAARVAKTTPAAWGVRARVEDASPVAWHVAERVTVTVDVEWNVDGAITRVTKTADVQWHTRARVTDSQATAWGVRSRAAALQDFLWGVRSRDADAAATAWQVAARVTVTRAVGWNTLSLADRGTVSIGVAWMVAHRDTITRGSSWRVLDRLQVARPVAWRELERGTTSADVAWAVILRGLAQAQTRWNVESLVKPGPFPARRTLTRAWQHTLAPMPARTLTHATGAPMLLNDDLTKFNVKKGDTYLPVVPSLPTIEGATFEAHVRPFGDDGDGNTHAVTVLDVAERVLGVHTAELEPGDYDFELAGVLPGGIDVTIPEEGWYTLTVWKSLA